MDPVMNCYPCGTSHNLRFPWSLGMSRRSNEGERRAPMLTWRPQCPLLHWIHVRLTQTDQRSARPGGMALAMLMPA